MSAVCPKCDQPLNVDLLMQSLGEEVLTYRIHPMPGSYLTAKTLGAQLKAIGRVLEICALDAGGTDMRAFVRDISRADDGSIAIELLVARQLPPEAVAAPIERLGSSGDAEPDGG